MVDALLQDDPYELYWFDKTAGFQYGMPYSYTSASISLGDYTISFVVASAYQDGGTYAMNTTYGQSASKAAENAKAIIAANNGKSDLAKLNAYREKICELVDYNDEAAAGGVSYGDPWQMVWVFDGDTSTNVVCEGYSKAFKYLCDNTSFGGKITAVCVTGSMGVGGSSGPHMWNLVKMPDGKNYLADITNCDSGSVGYPDLLFLCGYSSGSASAGYTYMAGSTAVKYVYGCDISSLFQAGELDTSDAAYAGDDPTAPPATATPTPTSTATAKPTPTPTATAKPTPTPTATAKPTPTPTATAKPTPTPTATATPTPTPTGSDEDPATPTPAGSDEDTATPTPAAPIADPATPTPAPTVGDTFTYSGLKYRITGAKTVSFLGLAKAKSKANVTIPATVKYAGKPYTVTEIAAKAMYKDTKVTAVTVGKSVKTIGKNAFAACTKLKTVKGGAAVVTLKDGAFSGCKVLKTFPALSKLQTVGANAFKGCAKLTAFTLGKAVKSIGKNAFNGCKALKTITVKTTKLTNSNIKAGAFKGIYRKATFKCPKSKLKAYKTLFVKKGAPKTCSFKK